MGQSAVKPECHDHVKISKFIVEIKQDSAVVGLPLPVFLKSSVSPLKIEFDVKRAPSRSWKVWRTQRWVIQRALYWALLIRTNKNSNTINGLVTDLQLKKIKLVTEERIWRPEQNPRCEYVAKTEFTIKDVGDFLNLFGTNKRDIKPISFSVESLIKSGRQQPVPIEGASTKPLILINFYLATSNDDVLFPQDIVLAMAPKKEKSGSFTKVLTAGTKMANASGGVGPLLESLKGAVSRILE